MEREANYTAVGAFVLLVIAMAVAFVYWYSDGRNARSYERYEVYFDGSVSGLNVGSTVRYLGVDIGRVVALNIDRRSAARVQVIVDIDSATPISEKTVAELSLLGVTGLLYVDLLGNAGTKKLAPLVESESYPVIRSVRSNFDAFLAGLPEVLGRASEVAQRANRLLSDDNLEALSITISNLERASRVLPDTVEEAQLLARELRTMSRDLSSVAVTLRQTTEQSAPLVSQSISKLSKASDNLLSASARVDTLLADSSGGITQFAQQGLPEFESLLRETRTTAEEVRELARELREEPSSLLYEKKPRGIEVPP